ncbi:MAG: orotidine-5'-phosphate decarboxylase [Acidimicrobiales bacterium]
MELRDRLALVLDVDDLVIAQRLGRQLKPYFGVAKVGLELYAAAGPEAVTTMIDEGFDVMLDLKLHDIPTTVRRAARVIGALGATYLTLHASGGPVMLRHGVDGLRDGAEAAGLPPPVALAVTILTSDADAPAHILGRRVAAAVEGGCGGLVCAATDVREAKELAPRMLAVVPGIRPAHADHHDQARASTPEMALAAGADLLVIGRAVTAAPDPAKAAAELVESLTAPEETS